MKKLINGIALLGMMFQLSAVHSEDTVEFSSSADPTAVVELYTSQGCSSCPPAEKWMNSLREDPGLWSQFVPLAFHVDYWDRLGWPDIYASADYSERQYQHRRENNIRSVYTPGMILSGHEWRGWIRNHPIKSDAASVGVLSFKADSQKVKVNYEEGRANVVLNMVLLGFGIDTKIDRGENRNRVLRQEFVVLSHQEIGRSNDGTWEVSLPQDQIGTAKEHAIAFWVSSPNNIGPIQSTGYWIPSAWVNGARKVSSLDSANHIDQSLFE